MEVWKPKSALLVAKNLTNHARIKKFFLGGGLMDNCVCQGSEAYFRKFYYGTVCERGNLRIFVMHVP